jgi:hypothetical protein
MIVPIQRKHAAVIQIKLTKDGGGIVRELGIKHEKKQRP